MEGVEGHLYSTLLFAKSPERQILLVLLLLARCKFIFLSATNPPQHPQKQQGNLTLRIL